MTGAPLEIERKYRLAAEPDAMVLADHGARASRIEQVYLREPPAGRRIRRIEQSDGTIDFRYTRKTHVRDLIREEEERAIDAAEFAALHDEADPDRQPIRKTRYVVPHGEQRLEIDVFEEPPGLVLVEVELRDEAEAVVLPQWLGEHRDVSTDDRFMNANLARMHAGVPPW